MYYGEHKKMVESLTNEQIGKRIVDAAVRELDSWIYRELEKLKHGKNPICLSFDDKTLYISGLFIKSKNKNMHQVYDNERTVHVFYSKHASVLYALLMHAKHIKMAETVLKTDRLVARSYDEIHYLKDLQQRLGRNGPRDELCIVDDKLHEANCKYQHYIKELEKNLIHAKYIKAWEKLK